ncbi:hypothetical protein BH09VER1_BH09VER1_05650 [soil metagenome]
MNAGQIRTSIQAPPRLGSNPLRLLKCDSDSIFQLASHKYSSLAPTKPHPERLPSLPCGLVSDPTEANAKRSGDRVKGTTDFCFRPVCIQT